MTRKYRRPVVALLLALAVLATATLGSAATVVVSAASISTFSATNPCTGTAQATPSEPVGNSGKYTGVEVVLPTGCSGTLQVAVLDDGSLLTTATVPAASGTVSINVGQYNPYDITVVGTLNGWHLPVAFGSSPATPAITCSTDSSTRPCTASITSNTPVPGGYDLQIMVADARTGSANNPAVWTVRLNFADPQFSATPGALSSADPVLVTSACNNLPLTTVVGATANKFDELTLGTVRTFTLQVRTSGTGNLLSCS